MKTFQIQENDANQRLDKFLKKLLANASLSLIFKLNRKNKVKVDWKKRDNEYRLNIWETVSLYLNDKEFELLTEKKEIPKINSNSFKLDKKDIVFEDSHLLVLNKPAWMIVHPGDFKTKELSLIQLVQDYLWDKLNSLTFKPSLVHRIDKDTSWIIIIAKTKKSLDSMLSQLQNNKIEKIYLAITTSSPKPDNWKIDKKILRIENAKNTNKVILDEKGQRAVTYYKKISDGIKWKYALLECKLETWRMHQIRVHLASIWTPILWDGVYWLKEENIFANKNYSISRQLLHAHRISFIHPESNKQMKLEARLKEDMQSLLD